MTRLVLVVPGLLWPAPQMFHPAEDVPHPALARLLGRGQPRMEAAVSYEHLLAQLLGAGPPLPLAALRRLGEGLAQNEDKAHWLCADPVNLSFMGAHVLLDELGEDEIDSTQAAALIATLNDEFSSLGRFSAATPTRWYLRMEQPAKARFFPLDEAVCRPVQDFLPTDEESSGSSPACKKECPEGAEEGGASHWRHILNEMQIVLHNHPVNTAREAAGQRPVNSLWLWGSGAQSAFGLPGAPRLAMQASDPMARGLARAAGIEPDMPDVGKALRTDTLAVIDTLASSARHLDVTRWQGVFAVLEQDWFAPISRALDSGALRHFALHVPGEHASFSFISGSGARWRFWRKPLLLSAVHYP